MQQIIAGFQGLVSYAVPMVILLGLLIFVHELGHFLVAKYYKVRVEVFSLGFGPKLLKFKRGDTVYAISALPLGGYVKMFGDDPTAEVDADQKAFSFTHKPVGQRIAVALAGPLMNFFFAIILFGGVAMIGEPALAPKLGDINDKSVAYHSGFRSGDLIVSADANPVKTWEELQHTIESSADRVVPIVVDRAGQQQTLEVTPKLAVNKNVMSWDRHVGEVDGLSYSSRATFVGVSDLNSLAAKAGVQTGDSIKSINGVALTKWRELREQMANAAKAGGDLQLQIERGLLDEKKTAAGAPVDPNAEVTGEIVNTKIAIPASIQGQDADQFLASLGIEYPELYLASLEKDSPAEKAGLKKGDRLISMAGQPLSSFDQIVSTIRTFGENHAKAGSTEAPTFDVVVKRGGEEKKVTLTPNLKERMSQQGKEERRYEIGIRPLIVDAMPQMVDLKSAGVIAAVSRGFSQTMKWTNLTVLSFVRLFQREVSPKNIGGFLSIGQMAKKSWQVGPSQFLNIMAIISINLFILNLLPVPVLDGGHLVFYGIEAIKGAPLSLRKMEIAQQVGIVLLLGLMVFALFNDVSRIIFN